jgi:uncharacterized protein YgbK (DUF1537 family)
MSAPITFIVADDLTGSADSALPFWRAGQRVTVVFDPDAPWPENPGVLSLCTHTRAMTEADARATVARLAPRLPAGARLFKKIDSTLRGWIGAESLALLAAHPQRTPVFVPAYPTKGRTLAADGVYRVHGAPLAGTEFAPEIAGLDADSRLDGFLARHFGALAPRVRVVPATVPDELAAVVAHSAEPILWIGSPGLGIALAGPRSLPAPALPPPARLAAASIVVGAGSRRSLTEQQVAALEKAVAPSAHGELRLLRIAASAYDAAQSAALADDLGRRVATATHALGDRPCGLILTGGDIAAATCRHLGIASAEIVGEVEDGLPVLRAGRFALVTKAGGFGDPHSLVRAYARLTSLLAS